VRRNNCRFAASNWSHIGWGNMATMEPLYHRVLRGHSVEYNDVVSAIAYLIEEEKTYRLREDGE